MADGPVPSTNGFNCGGSTNQGAQKMLAALAEKLVCCRGPAEGSMQQRAS